MATAETALERAEGLAERLLPDRTPKRRMLVIVNPYATTVSDRLRNLVVYALGSRYAVEAIDTQERGHAMQICREAASEGYDVVVAFGGDGTVNEAANGLVGLAYAAHRAARRLDQRVGPHARHPERRGRRHRAPAAHGRRVRAAPAWTSGGSNERHFVFAAGAGLDASVVERVDAHPYRKARFGAWYYSVCAVDIFMRRYLVNPPRVRVIARRPRPGGRDRGRPELGPVHLLPQAPDPRGGAGRAQHGLPVDRRAEARDRARAAHAGPPPPVLPRPERHAPPPGRAAARAAAARVEAIDDRPFPVQVDGDYIGEFSEVEFGVKPGGLLAVG